MHSIRFHLKPGTNFRKWQIKPFNGTSVQAEYLTPEDTILRLDNVELVNNRAGAEKINQGAHKFVVACAKFEQRMELNALQGNIIDSLVCDGILKELRYNPKDKPYWQDAEGNNVDGRTFELVYVKGRKLYSKV